MIAALGHLAAPGHGIPRRLSRSVVGPRPPGHRGHGTEQDTAGDGFFATFEGPARAIRCAHEIVQSVHSLGLETRVGVHTGECRLIDGKVGGIAVTTGARVAATAAPSEVRVSQTVKDLVAGPA